MIKEKNASILRFREGSSDKYREEECSLVLFFIVLYQILK